MYALDTNCLVRWLLWDNPEQAKKVNNTLDNSACKIHVADLAIVETAWVLKSVYQFDDKIIEELLRKILEHKNINCNRALFKNVLDSLNNGSPKVSLTDICLVYYAKLSDANTLLTFDVNLVKRFPKLSKLL